MHSLLKDLGQVSAIIGAQWGDEGKGKVTDILGEHFDIIARACGGANAGHTIVVQGKKHIFHLLPAGCLHDKKPVILGAGMVIHLPTLIKEIDTLLDAGIDLVPRLRISASAHILFDYHKTIDAWMEETRTEAVGTTKRGIGPAYSDKAARIGIRMGRLNDDLQPELSERATILKKMYNISVDMEQEINNLSIAKMRLSSCISTQLPELMHTYENQGKKILIEGAQATLLDLDHGTYPFVTSSFTTAAGALQGLGMAPRTLRSCIGVAKAYCTRVGAGYFHTEDSTEAGNRLRERGGEYGSTTGRPRRCGWLHLPDLLFSAMVNGYSCFNLTKLDVLDEEAEIPVGVSLDSNGKVLYKKLRGWQRSTKGLTSYEQLPKEAREYIEFIETSIGIPIRLIGTGQGREDVIVR